MRMGKKKRRKGHYCLACGDYRPNEKFSGKGHRRHLCKDCKGKRKKAKIPFTSEYDKEVSGLSKAIKDCLLLYTGRSRFFLFEYQSRRYITRDDFKTEVFLYQGDSDQKFFIDESLQMNEALLDVLYKKYYDTLESDLTVDYSEWEVGEEFVEVSKKRKQQWK